MARNPKDASESPINVDETDVVSDVLRAVRLTAEVFGRFELSAPWAMRVPGGDYLAFYVIARGGAWLELEAEGRRKPTHQVTLSAGDVVLLPHGGTHVLRDPSRSVRSEYTVGAGSCPRPTTVEPVRFGGGGPMTSFVAGAFRFGAAARSV